MGDFGHTLCLHFLRMKSDGEDEDDGFECQTYSPGLRSEEQFGEREVKGQHSRVRFSSLQ